ncbi:MAG: Na/Pi cotransporter family protein [Ruminococcaceae bacterium]|nr:Na/Pi cotransporter family protein [Oscillospiraceae bacterium]
MGGLAFFLYGMTVMSSGLEKMAGGKLEQMLKKATSKPLVSMALGAGITIAIQSSSAMTVMLVGLVNSGIMKFGQTIGVIMGSNIGTTLTTWLLALVGIESDVVWLKMMKPDNFSLIFALVGAVLIMMSKKAKFKDIGKILVGFAVLMLGMSLMSDSMKPLAEMEGFADVMLMFQNPFLAVLVGAAFTGIIQSSAASVGVLIGLASTGAVSYGMAIPIIMGQNIGTCVTALISSIGVNKNAKKVAVVHISFNVIGTILCLALFYLLNAFGVFEALFHVENFAATPIPVIGITIVHTIFNIFTTFILFPFRGALEKLANIIMKEKDGENIEHSMLDDRLLATPSVAIAEANDITYKMADIAQKSIGLSFDLVHKYDDKEAKNVLDFEDMLDKYEDRLGTYLVQLSSRSMSDADTNRVSKMLHVIGDFERLGDHAVNILKVAEELRDKKLSFSENATQELKVLMEALNEILDITFMAYKNNDVALATRVEPLEQVIDELVAIVKTGHIKRLQAGICTIEMGFILSDLINNCERISDHCSNIAVTVIELAHNSFDTHKYLQKVKHGNEEFDETFEEFSKKYEIKA